MWSGTVLYPAYAAGERVLGDLAADRPGDRRRDHDGPRAPDHPRRARLTLLRWAGARHRAAASCSTSPPSAACRSTRARAERAVAPGTGRGSRNCWREARVEPRTASSTSSSSWSDRPLGAEIAAARLMAPFFGASTIVWANTIGVVLVALSVGYWLGGRLADRHPELRQLCLVVLAAAVLLAVIPFVAQPLPRLGRRPGRDRGRRLRRLAVRRALADRDPGALLGTVSPWAIRLAVAGRRARGAGRGPAVRDLDGGARCWGRCWRPWC